MKDYERESKALEKLRHPNIVAFFGIEELTKEDGQFYVIRMEYCERDSLRKVLENREIIYNWKTVLVWAEHLTKALLYLKNNQIVHRDIKPENVLVAKDFVLKLGDFGLVKDLSSSSSCPTRSAGTFRYMSPEAYGAFDRHIPTNYPSDLYSTALILWEIVERRPVFTPEYDGFRGFDHFTCFRDLKTGAYKLVFTGPTNELKDMILACTNFQYDQRPVIEFFHQRVVQMNMEFRAQVFEPTLKKGEKKLIRPTWTDREASDAGSSDHDLYHLLPPPVGTTTSFITLRVTPSNHQISANSRKQDQASTDPIELKSDFTDSITTAATDMTLEEAQSNLEILVQNDENLLRYIRNQIERCTKFPVNHVFLLDQLPDFPPVIDDELINFFKTKTLSDSMISKVEFLLKTLESQFKVEYKNLISYYEEAINLMQRLYESPDISRLQRTIEQVHKIIQKASGNFFYSQWFVAEIYMDTKDSFLLISKEKSLFL